jgi:hypothetical protein
VLAVVVTGCSFMSIERLPAGRSVDETPRCSKAPMAVGADAVWTVLGTVVLLAAGHSSVTNDERTGAQKAEAMTIGSTWFVLAATSLRWGLRQHERCDRARSAHDEWMRSPSRGTAPPGA